ncbi:uncharacterized protein KQ657_004303 [Scheffersomyces spartinae]|uniref:Protein CASP n=1 Tax=Scheffersomyces spartinae TaxID=45513 RepID=A0A9P8AJZ9_9ASCO|nr:uncharacterized protein KQ657_004303 [Scheffersomyces spartinae]KAG7194627.1 hypothetical protein KQ657_004303 [Scheffersomyces spartinae]
MDSEGLVSKRPVGGSKSSGSHVFSDALQSWTEIDLPTLQKQLDDQGISLKEDQKASLLGRKELAAKTKEFRKLSEEEKLDQIKPLLKLYQNEIDSLNNKKKVVENYFFGIYRVLAEAPDPRPLLEISVDTVMESADADELKNEITRLNEELSKKADYDQLKDRLLKTEQKNAEVMSLKLNAKEEEMKALLEEKESNWVETEAMLNQQLKDYHKQIEELRTSKEVTELQLNSQNAHRDSDINSASILAELEVVSREAENAKKRIFDLQKRNEKLRAELSRSQQEAEFTSLKVEFEKRTSELEGENSLLLANLNETKRKLDDLRHESALKNESYTRDSGRVKLEISSLKEKLAKTSDYDEIKHELQLLRQIEFGEEEDSDNNDGEANEDKNEFGSILSRRNKVLSNELATMRAKQEDYEVKISQLEGDLNATKTELSKVQQLAVNLENDLVDVQDATGSVINDNASIISGMTGVTRMTRNNLGGLRKPSLAPVSEESSILPIITKQRDRFRDRNNELEEEVKKQFNIVSDMRRQINQLKKDNEELYEKTRYLAAINTQHGKKDNHHQRRTLLPKQNAIDLEDNPYQKSYETKLHPIEQFRIREQERINARLSPIERLFISFTRAVLSTRATRMLFFFYCLGLHLIVMFTIIHTVSTNSLMIAEVGINSGTGGIPTS